MYLPIIWFPFSYSFHDGFDYSFYLRIYYNDVLLVMFQKSAAFFFSFHLTLYTPTPSQSEKNQVKNIKYEKGNPSFII